MTECPEFKKAFSLPLPREIFHCIPHLSTWHFIQYSLSFFREKYFQITAASQNAMRNKKLSVCFLSHTISSFLWYCLWYDHNRKEITTSSLHICLFQTKPSKSDFIIPEYLKTFITLQIWTLWRRLFTSDMNWLLLHWARCSEEL